MASLEETEYRAAISREAGSRYAYFIRQVVQDGHIWMLGDEDGCMLAEDPEGRDIFPIWSHRRYAEACARDIWEGAQAVAFDLDAFFSLMFPNAKEGNALFGVFPLPGGQAAHVEPSRLLTDLREATQRLAQSAS